VRRRFEGPAAARAAIVEAAWALFASDGYDATTVQAIIDRVGFSKGGFYHHFSSKEEVLDAVVRHMHEHGRGALQPVLDAPVGALEKLVRFMGAAREWRFSNLDLVLEVVLVLAREENAVVRHKLDHLTLEEGLPILAAIVGQGVDEGVFHVDDPDGAAEAILLLSFGIADRQAHAIAEMHAGTGGAEAVLRRINLFQDATERILGVGPGSLGRVGPEVVDRITSALARRNEPDR
jgi:AcrR family transcriptional regulator